MGYNDVVCVIVSSCPPPDVYHGTLVKVAQVDQGNMDVTFQCDMAYEFPHGERTDTFICEKSIWTKPPVDCQSKRIM